MRISVRVNSGDYGLRTLFAIIKEVDDKCFIFLEDEWIPLDTIGIGPEKFTFMVPVEARDEVLQQLVNLLSGMGFNPEKAKAAEVEIDRIENHLVDAIEVRDRLLSMIEISTKSVIIKQ